MTQELWLACLTATAGVIGWSIRQAFVAFERLKKENEVLRTEKSDDLKLKLDQFTHEFESKMALLSEKLSENIMAVARFESRVDRMNEVFNLVHQLEREVTTLRAWIKPKKFNGEP